ncbi:MAG TPA: ribosome biogenesis GTP-binding protein YihA/YsxC [Steroidobacteraceae bacterium]|nr:ribosome biogenesis GTP-binding protein YihA/YsxC [Steroidobacteraceae bacterium]
MSSYGQVRFVKSAWQPRQFVADEGAEIAFAGRSNAGKSSAINAITGRTGLARTSKTPGQTQLVNFFELGPERRLVDLPGYGYAKVPGRMQRHWRELMTAYFERRVSLVGVFLIMDARRPLLDFDRQMLEWVEARGLPVHLVVTKADKLSRSDANLALKRVRKATGVFASSQLFAAPARRGVDEARDVLESMFARQWCPAETGAAQPVPDKKNPGGL